MLYIILGIAGFALVHLFDLASLKRISGIKPFLWGTGSGLLVYSIIMIIFSAEKLQVLPWLTWLGWGLLLFSLPMLIYALFGGLPFHKTYLEKGVGDGLITTGIYSLTRHPGVIWFSILMLALIPVAQSRLLLIATPVFIGVDILLVTIQDRYIFTRMFEDYDRYRQRTPMLLPNRQSLSVFLKSLNKKKQSINHGGYTMSKEAEYIVQRKDEKLWQRCCGFIDLSLEECMNIQRRLLLEQIQLLKKCRLGNSIMRRSNPESVDEFRQQIPLTTYADYEPFLLTKNDKALPAKPLFWQHTSGRSGEYPFKWAPVTARQFEEIRAILFACLAFSSCNDKGQIAYRRNDKFLYALAPPPYTTGSLIHYAPHEVFDFLPPIKAVEGMSFEDRIHLGFQLALSEGVDLFFALSSVIVALGERFSQGSGNIELKPLLVKPKILFRLLKGVMKSKLAHRHLLPKDIWKLKGLIGSGSDSSVFRERIKEMWGRYPLDVYGGTEGIIMATQTWDYEGLSFIPHTNFYEFIPEEESLRAKANPLYQPKTVLLDEVKAGENYEMVITSFHGGPFIRYKLGDMIYITSLRNDKLNIDIPQMVFHARVDDMIDVAGFTRLTEKIIWQAIENTGLDYEDWTIRKELRDKPILHLYLELKKNGYSSEEEVAVSVHEQLKALDKPYADLETFIGLRPLEVTLLPETSFESYMLRQQATGADLAHLKPPHINLSDSGIDDLINGGKPVTVTAEEEYEETVKQLQKIRRRRQRQRQTDKESTRINK
jgi:protein-S-isoprenylcysteine O-methyltransferase Ste14